MKNWKGDINMKIVQIINLKTLFILVILSMILIEIISCSSNTGPEKDDNICDPSKYIDTTRQYFYYYDDKPKYLTLAKDLFCAKYDSILTIAEIEENLSEYNIVKIGKLPYDNYFLKTPKDKRAEEFYTFYEYDTDCGFGNQKIAEHANPIFWARPGIDSSLIILTDEFIVMIDTTKMNTDDLIAINSKYYVKIHKRSLYDKRDYILKVTKESKFNALDMANLYQDSSFAIISAPNYLELGINPYKK